jgi:cytochrome c oxidase subunit 3
MSAPVPVLDRPLDERNGGGGVPGRPGGGDGGGGEPAPDVPNDPRRFGLWLFLGSLTMLFVGFTSAYIVRRTAADWAPLEAPGLLWANGLVLILSSATLEVSRRRLRGWDLVGTQAWLAATGALGGLFLLGQIMAWRILAGQGIYVASNPHSSFFYVLTGLHALHLMVGLIWFTVALWRVRRLAYTPGDDGLSLFATYWHFLSVLWVYLFVLLFLA